MSFDRYKIYNGKSIADLSRETDIKAGTISYRLRNGWTLEDAVSVQVTAGGSKAKTKHEVDGKTFTDRFGNEFIVNGIHHRDSSGVIHYNVKFLKTGYETIAVSSQIRGLNNKHVQDRLSPSVLGVGMLGYAYSKDDPKMFNAWRAMIARCYNEKNTSYKTYGAKGIKVCERWLRFDYFLEDVKHLPGYNKEKIDDGKLVLDKDIINRDLKLYCPETCCFVSRSENTRESSLRTHKEKKCNDHP